MRFVSFTFHPFERQHPPPKKFNEVLNLQPQNYQSKCHAAELTEQQEQRVSQSFSLVLLNSNFKESWFKRTTSRPAHQIPECPAFDSFIWRTVFKTQTDSRIKLTISELHDSPPTHWATWTSGVWTWTLVCVLFCALFLQTVDVNFFCCTLDDGARH